MEKAADVTSGSYIFPMTTIPAHPVPLVDPAQFLSAIRDAGYPSAAAAVSELVDNSIQAEATEIAIEVVLNPDTRQFTISVSDNGTGMTAASTRAALQFGGSTRFNDRTSLGRFGMGLPAASLSLSRRVQITSRTLSSSHSATLDMDSPHPLLVTEYEDDQSIHLNWDTGTHVVLSECDRVDYARTGNLVNSLTSNLGRTYRTFLQNGVQIVVNGAPVVPLDPLLRQESEIGLKSQPFGDTRFIPIRVEDQIFFVEIDFVELPIEECLGLSTKEKRALGITGGTVMSVLRAGREIASGWLLAGHKRRENYDDWWRCEIRFDPELDEYFGLTYTKQGIRPSRELRRAIEAEIESTARILNKRARTRFEYLKAKIDALESCAAATRADPGLPPLGLGARPNSGPTRYRMEMHPSTSSALISASTGRGELTVLVNADHPIHHEIARILSLLPDDSSRELRRVYESLLIALARTDVLVGNRDGSESSAITYQELWGTAASAIMRVS